MPMKFKCTACGQEIVTQYLSPGETAKCRKCGASVQVPQDAQIIDREEAASYQDNIKIDSKDKYQTPSAAIEAKNKMSRSYSRHAGWITLLKVLGWIFFIVGGIVGLLFLIVGIAGSTNSDGSGPASMVLALYIFFIAVAGGIFYIALAIIIECLIDMREKISDLSLR